MVTSCLANDFTTKNYLNFSHPHQINIRKIFEEFTETIISKRHYGIDGCSAPQYAFKIIDLSKALNNLLKSYNNNFNYNLETTTLINSIIKNPKFIGGSDSLDSNLMSICKNNLFCKGGAEGIFLFIHLKKRITGVFKVQDGNERALPSTVYNILKKFKIVSKKELENIKRSYNFDLKNHANVNVGSIITEIL